MKLIAGEKSLFLKKTTNDTLWKTHDIFVLIDQHGVGILLKELLDRYGDRGIVVCTIADDEILADFDHRIRAEHKAFYMESKGLLTFRYGSIVYRLTNEDDKRILMEGWGNTATSVLFVPSDGVDVYTELKKKPYDFDRLRLTELSEMVFYQSGDSEEIEMIFRKEYGQELLHIICQYISDKLSQDEE